MHANYLSTLAFNRPLDRYAKLRVVHARRKTGTFPPHRGLTISACITARASRTCRDACRDRKLAVSFEVGGGENVPGIPGTFTTRNFTYLVRGPCTRDISSSSPRPSFMHATYLSTLAFNWKGVRRDT